MARLTRLEIVNEGQLLAGRDDMGTQATAWLQRWLDSVAASWPWPLLHREVAVPVPAGTRTLDVGNGQGGVTEQVTRILDNVWAFDAGHTTKTSVRVRHFYGVPIDVNAASPGVGRPQTIRILTTGATGQWELQFEPVPDAAYLLSLPVIIQPSPMTDDSDVPWYPNDETMVQAVAFKVHEYHDGKDSPVTQASQQMLAGLVANDRIRYGAVTGTNDRVVLDPAVFKR